MHTTVHRACLTCSAETALTVPADAWHAWTVDMVPARHAFTGVDSHLRRWIAEMICPDCWTRVVTSAPADYLWEGTCAGCGNWETVAVSPLALAAHHAGDLTDTEAFPGLTDTQRCLIEMSCHAGCYDTAVYGRPPGEPNPFAPTH